MAAAQTRSVRKPSRPMRRRGGRQGRPVDDSTTTPEPQSPLAFALAVMRDATKPDALRAGMAKAALPYVHKRGEEQETEEKPKRQTLSDLELARRIAHILELGRKEEAHLPEKERTIPSANAGGDTAFVLARIAPASPTASIDPPRSNPSEPIRPADEPEPYNIYSDPHPGYRWI